MSVSHLRTVGETDTPSGLPDFEGQPVSETRLKLTAVAKLETGEQWSRIDDTVRLYVEGQIVRIDHVVDGPTGKLVRVHTLKVVDAIPLPWDFDTGLLD
jgi:hypothetical protein